MRALIYQEGDGRWWIKITFAKPRGQVHSVEFCPPLSLTVGERCDRARQRMRELEEQHGQ
jgi:hypothetical protein